MASKAKDVTVTSETLGPEIQEDFLPDMPPAPEVEAGGTAAADDQPTETPPPSTPETFTFRADVANVYAEKYVLLMVNGEKTATLDFDKGDVSYEGQDVTELQEGYEGMTFTIPYPLAVEKHLPEFLGVTAVAMSTPAPAASDEDDDAPQAAPYQKKLREETITVTVALDAAEREACGQRMADAIKRKKTLEDQLDSYRKSINHQIKAVEAEISAAADLWYEGQEERRVDCDVIADYNTGELVWCEREYPYKEVKRQRMTEKDRQLPLPLDMAPAHQDEAMDVSGEAPAVTGTTILYGRLDKITEDDITITFTDNEGEGMQFTLPKAGVSYEDGLEVGDSGDFTMPTTLAISAGIIDAPEAEADEAQPEDDRSCDSCAHLYSPHTEGEDDPCFDCGNAEDKPNWQAREEAEEAAVPAGSQEGQAGAEVVQ